jgi:hypothetical protein
VRFGAGTAPGVLPGSSGRGSCVVVFSVVVVSPLGMPKPRRRSRRGL